MVSGADLSEQEKVYALDHFTDSVFEGKGLSAIKRDILRCRCSKCGEESLDVGWGTTDTIKWIFFCGHGYEVVMNFHRDTIKRLVESLL
jgi:hypothetical protein